METAKQRLLYALLDQPISLAIESRNGLLDRADEEYRLVDDSDGTVVLDWGSAFPSYAEAYEEIAKEPIGAATRDVTVIDDEFARAWIEQHITYDDLANYLIADSGDRFAMNADGSTYISESAGMEIADESDRPVVWTKCPGLGHADMTWWRNDWDCSHLGDAEVIRDCCKNGDVEGEMEDFINDLVESMAFSGFGPLRDALLART